MSHHQAGPDLRARRHKERAVTDHRDERNPAPASPMLWNAVGYGSEGTALESAEERVAQPAELPPEAVAAGFRLEPVGDRVRLFHHCGNVVWVDDPTDPQLPWYIRAHRCGPATSEWHIGAIEQPLRRNPTTPAHLMRSRLTPQPHGRGPQGVA